MSVPYHKQEQGNYCGAACAKMVIEALGEKAASQTTLFNQSQAHGQYDAQYDWAGPPDGLEWLLENKGEVPPALAEVADPEGEAAITRRAIWSLYHHNVPPMVLTEGWAHWVVVVDYKIENGPPSGPADTSYQIDGVRIYDPTPELGEEMPPPRFVTFDKWRRDYLSPVPLGHWQGSRVAVGVFASAS